MKFRILNCILGLCALIMISACGRQTEPVDPKIPEALQESSFSEVSFDYGSKGRYEADLVDELFEEIRTKRPDIQKAMEDFEAMIKDADEQINALHAKDEKSEKYYASAISHAMAIHDSISQALWLDRIARSETQWKTSLNQRNALDAALQSQKSTLEDEIEILKIRLTQPQIEYYQQKNVPDLKPGRDLVSAMKKLAKEVQSLPAE